jgi:rhomboid protease GluP
MTICASCGREFQASSDTETLCPQCSAEGLQVMPADAAPSRLRQAFESPTIILIALNTLVYLLMALQSHSFLNFNLKVLLDWGANSGALTSGGQWWRLLTSTFEHGGLLHIALNMWCLYNLGWLAELLFGRSRFTVIYLLCGIGGSLASICWRGNGVSVGASGAIFGIAGALIPAMLLHSNQQLRAALKGQLTSIAIFVFYNLAFGAAAHGVDNAAHVGGLLTGLLLGAAFPTGPERNETRGRTRAVAATFVMAVALVGVGAYAHQRNQSYIEIDKAAAAHQHGDDNAAIALVQRAIALKPGDAQAQFMLGTLLLGAHHDADAAKAFTATTRLRPNFGPAYVNLCVAQRDMKQLNEALSNCEQGTRLSPNEPESWFNLGRIRYELHNLAGARDALAKAVSLNPEGFDENLQYALMLISNGETEKAVPYLHKAHDLHPKDAGVTRLLIQVLAH